MPQSVRRFDLQIRAHGPDDPAGDGEPHAAPGEEVAGAAQPLLEGAEEVAPAALGDAPPRVAHVELHAGARSGALAPISTHPSSVNFSAFVVRFSRTRPSGDGDGRRPGRTRAPRYGARRPSPPPWGWTISSTPRTISDDGVALRLAVDEAPSLAREVDHVRGEGREAERGAVDEPELAALLLVHLTAVPVRSVSERKRIEVSGERRSWATSTRSWSASGCASRAARLSGRRPSTSSRSRLDGPQHRQPGERAASGGSSSSRTAPAQRRISRASTVACRVRSVASASPICAASRMRGSRARPPGSPRPPRPARRPAPAEPRAAGIRGLWRPRSRIASGVKEAPSSSTASCVISDMGSPDTRPHGSRLSRRVPCFSISR